MTRTPRLRLVLAAAAVAGCCGPLVGSTVSEAAGPVSATDLAALESRVQALTVVAEQAQHDVETAAQSATALRIELDTLAEQRDAQQDEVDSALVALYEQSQVTPVTIGPSLGAQDPALARVYGLGVADRADAIDTLDAQSSTVGKLSEDAQAYHDLLAGKTQKVYDALDKALDLLQQERAVYARQQQAAAVARVDAEAAKLRTISDQVTRTAAPGLGRRGTVALDQQAGVLALLEAAGSGYPKGYAPTGQTFDGTSSWYGPGFEGRPTATGAPFDPEKLTAAMKAVPLGTVIHVTYGGRAVNLLVNDRGPYVGNRIIDCSRAGSRALGFDGLAQVHIEVLGPTG